MLYGIPIFLILAMCGPSTSPNWEREMVTLDHRQKREAGRLAGCIDYKFRCLNAACVESATNILESLVCPPVSYHCDFASTRFVCNGHSNCVNKDDPQCPGFEETYSRTGNCGKDKFQCKNKQCVHEDEVCNGKADCTDGSDETTQICINNYCPSYAFRCAYGGCVPMKSRCNRVIDCIDSSDETVALCGKLPFITQQSTGYRPPGSCAIPAFENGRVLSPITNEIYTPQHFARNGEQLLFECLNTRLVGGNESYTSTYCINGLFLLEPPTCEKGCSTLLLDTLSVQATCTDMHLKPISCTEFVPLFTVANLHCKTGYERPQLEDRDFEDSITCREDGQWSQHVGRCDPVCGEIASGEPLIFGGRNTTISEVPWHVGVYELQNGSYTQICGGSIISETVIISAAHCFRDEKNKLKDVNSLEIVAGKTFRDYYAEETGTQIFKITKMSTPSGYLGAGNYFMGDFAVVGLKTPIIYQTFIRPICTSNPKIAAMNVVNGTKGKVAGWGRNENYVYTPVLKVVYLKAVDYQTCIEKNHISFHAYVTPDKFGAFIENESVCQGDSGGGFAVALTRSDGVVKYYLRGLVSVAPKVSVGLTEAQLDCQAGTYTTFTNAMFYEYLVHEFTHVWEQIKSN